MSDSLRSLTRNEQMSELLVFLANRSFAHYSLIFFAKNERFYHKTNERIPNPVKQFHPQRHDCLAKLDLQQLFSFATVTMQKRDNVHTIQ